MASVYKTPGVYVEEIPKLPPSIAQVETAIPAFVGYTKQAEKRGESLHLKPTRISSLLEFREYYGGDNPVDEINVTVDENNNYAVSEIEIDNDIRYIMYDSLRLFFDNGGGDCYIVSVGVFGTAPDYGDENAATPNGLRAGVKALEKYDEPTIILFPDAVNVVNDGNDDPGFYSLQQMALQQCSKLQDRVGLLDLKENIDGDLDNAITNYRNNIGINDLKYGAAYTPFVVATYPRTINISDFRDHISDSSGNITLKDLSSESVLLDLIDKYDDAARDAEIIDNYLTKIKRANITDGANLGDFDDNVSEADMSPSLKEKFLVYKKKVESATTAGPATDALQGLFNFTRNAIVGFQDTHKELVAVNSSLAKDVNTYAQSSSLWKGAIRGTVEIEKNGDVFPLNGLGGVTAIYPLYNDSDGEAPYTDWVGSALSSILVPAPPKDYGNPGNTDEHPAMAKSIANDLLKEFEKLMAFADSLVSAANSYKNAAQEALYEQHPVLSSIVKNIKKKMNTLPPSGAIAGIYAKIDNSRGVWKAPANVSINSVSEPSVMISHDEQANINVDAVAGKSINAIRSFTGKGTMVWGARTLAGNDNEWRYISVRRFFNMVEESCKKSTEPFVFEPNDASTWIKVQTMIENYLTNLWRQGALQGAKPEHAFYVAVGLGKTMTSVDILEGRLIVEIGMAVVRPAEFIILQFSHKLAES